MLGKKEFRDEFQELKKKHPKTEKLNQALQALLLEYAHPVRIGCSKSTTYVCDKCRGR